MRRHCDVDSEHLTTSAAECEKAQGSAPRQFKDYRELIAMPGLDALIIGTPPHWHTLNFIEACKKGLPVYLEKPISYDVREGRAMVNAWKKAGNIVQVGFQRRQQVPRRSCPIARKWDISPGVWRSSMGTATWWIGASM